MEEKNEYWLKYGFKESGELVCIKMLAESKPAENFFYVENNETKEVKNPKVVKLTKDNVLNLE